MISNSQEMVLGFLLAMLTLVATARTRDTPNLNPHSKLVVFSFDGFRYDYLTKAHVPTLNRLKESGVTTPYMIPQFTTKTFTNHQSIVTGLYSENHGIVENAVFDPLLNQELSGYEDDHDFWDYSNDVIPIWVRKITNQSYQESPLISTRIKRFSNGILFHSSSMNWRARDGSAVPNSRAQPNHTELTNKSSRTV